MSATRVSLALAVALWAKSEPADACSCVAPEPEMLSPSNVEEVAGLGGVRSLALDATGTCALTVKDELYGWGALPHLPADPQAPKASPVRIAVE